MKKLTFILGLKGENFFFDKSFKIIYHTELPLTEETKNNFTKWCKEYEDIYDDNYPPDSQFPSKESEIKWIEKGKNLFNKIKSELGDEYEVEFPENIY